MRCPRCHAPVPAAVPPAGAGEERRAAGEGERAPSFCRECGAPLRLGDEPRPPPLDASVVMDRRAAGRAGPESTFTGLPMPGAAPGTPARGATGELAALERSHWDLRVPAAAEGTGPRTGAAAAIAHGETTPGQGLPDAEVDALEVHLRRPPSWRRAAADALDFLPFAAGGIALGRSLVLAAAAGLPAPATGIDGFLDLLARERVIVLSIAAAVTLAMGTYATLAHALAGATLGKRLLGLAVVGPDGARPSLGRSTARSALAVLSAALLGLGLLLPFFTRSGRALHDLVARTWVVEAPP